MSAAAMALLVTIAAKATLLLLPASAALLCARRASAAVRHWIAFLAVAAVLLLPALSVALPPLDLRVLPAASGGLASADAFPGGPGAGGQRVAAVLLAAWFAGVLLLLARFACAHLGAHRLRRESVALASRHWRRLAASVGRELGLRSRVPVHVHTGVRAPLAVGLLRPAVILPPSAAAWAADHRRAVLIHEMAHVRRRDCLTQMVAQLASALLWFHPLVWWMGRVMGEERERACDDLVLAQGARPSGYATLLVRLRGLFLEPRAAPAGAVAFGLRSGLKGRIESLLERRSRRLLTADHHFWLASALLVLLLPLAAVRPARAEPARRVPTVAAVADQPAASAPRPAPMPEAPAPAPLEERAPNSVDPVALSPRPERPIDPRILALFDGGCEMRFEVGPGAFRLTFSLSAEVRPLR